MINFMYHNNYENGGQKLWNTLNKNNRTIFFPHEKEEHSARTLCVSPHNEFIAKHLPEPLNYNSLSCDSAGNANT